MNIFRDKKLYFERLLVNDDDGRFSIPFIFDEETKSGQSSSV
jgi:hypothetical protein